MLENLFLNAVKYGDEGSLIVCKLSVVEGRDVVIDVTNRGTPIPRDDWETIFQPFTRGSRTGASEGWGIGLAYARAVAVGHGGSVRVAASGSAGTTFEIRLPLDARAAMATPQGSA